MALQDCRSSWAWETHGKQEPTDTHMQGWPEMHAGHCVTVGRASVSPSAKWTELFEVTSHVQQTLRSILLPPSSSIFWRRRRGRREGSEPARLPREVTAEQGVSAGGEEPRGRGGSSDTGGPTRMQEHTEPRDAGSGRRKLGSGRQ